MLMSTHVIFFRTAVWNVAASNFSHHSLNTPKSVNLLLPDFRCTNAVSTPAFATRLARRRNEYLTSLRKLLRVSEEWTWSLPPSPTFPRFWASTSSHEKTESWSSSKSTPPPGSLHGTILVTRLKSSVLFSKTLGVSHQGLQHH